MPRRLKSAVDPLAFWFVRDRKEGARHGRSHCKGRRRGTARPWFLEIPRNCRGDPVSVEGSTISQLPSAGRVAYVATLDAEPCSSPPEGARIHDGGRRAMATRLGDATFSLRTCAGRYGNASVPFDEALDFTPGTRVSPALEALLISLCSCQQPLSRNRICF